MAPFYIPQRDALVDNWLFGRQHVRTKVLTGVDDPTLGPVDVADAATGTWLDDPFGLEEDLR